ncbi:MmcQ/YjbR family DNA-binding protein [Nocardioides humilatus]|uniref:MmcQ/YjbR family DNA-binding protein n=1 Tax=Nocardioides humilatus TaxID=2607660 RepID=UPI001CB6C70C|nr:MmcQ/YjbR family DNA-binding protein [Nocardioides humilatus]
MTDADAVRRVALPLPRVYEREIGGHWKLKVKQLVFVAFAKDETKMGFAFPREERDALIESAPDVFFLPRTSDLRYQWVCAHLDRLGEEEMSELITDAWRMCVPAMLHDLPELPAPAAEVWSLIDAGATTDAVPLLHPYLHWHDRDVALRGRNNVLAHLREHPAPKPPREVEVRDGQIYRWVR